MEGVAIGKTLQARRSYNLPRLQLRVNTVNVLLVRKENELGVDPS
jgi:hypothetical protein